MPHVQGSLVLLPVVGVGVVGPVDAGVVPHRVDQEVGDCGEHSITFIVQNLGCVQRFAGWLSSAIGKK